MVPLRHGFPRDWCAGHHALPSFYRLDHQPVGNVLVGSNIARPHDHIRRLRVLGGRVAHWYSSKGEPSKAGSTEKCGMLI